MSLFSLFSRPKVEKLRGYVEPDLSITQLPELPSSRALKSHDIVPSRDVSKLSPPRGTTAMSVRPQSSRTVLVRNKASPQPPEESSWTVLPLAQAMEDAIKFGVWQTSSSRYQMDLQGSSFNSRKPRTQGGLETEPKRDGSRRSSLSKAHSHFQPSLTTKMFVLCTSGYLLQYSSRGSDDRLPERIIQLGKDSAAFACDLIPGRPYVLQVAQALDSQGSVVVGTSPSFFTKLGFGGTASRRLTPSMLLVMDEAYELQGWQNAIRKEIELLGGYMDFSKAIEKTKKQQRRSAIKGDVSTAPPKSSQNSSINDSRNIKTSSVRSSISAGISSTRDAHHQLSERVAISTSPRQSSDTTTSSRMTSTKTASSRSRHQNDQSSEPVTPATSSTTSPTLSLPLEMGPWQPGPHVKRTLAAPAGSRSTNASPEAQLAIERRMSPATLRTETAFSQGEDSTETPFSLSAQTLPSAVFSPSKRLSYSQVYHVPSNASLKALPSLNTMQPSIPPAIKEDLFAESPVMGRQALSAQPKYRRPFPLPIRAEGQTINRSVSHALPSPRTGQPGQSRRVSSMVFHNQAAPQSFAPAVRPLQTQSGHSLKASAVVSADGTERSDGTARVDPISSQDLPFKLRSSVRQPVPESRSQTPPRAPTPKLSLFPTSSSPPLAPTSSPPLKNQAAMRSAQKALRRPASFQIRPSPAPAVSSYRSSSTDRAGQDRQRSHSGRPSVHTSRSASHLRSTMTPVSESFPPPTSPPRTTTATDADVLDALPAPTSYDLSTYLPPSPLPSTSGKMEYSFPSRRESAEPNQRISPYLTSRHAPISRPSSAMSHRAQTPMIHRPSSAMSHGQSRPPSSALQSPAAFAPEAPPSHLPLSLSLPALDFGMPLVALAPPPPPPQSPLPSLPGVVRGSTPITPLYTGR